AVQTVGQPEVVIFGAGRIVESDATHPTSVDQQGLHPPTHVLEGSSTRLPCAVVVLHSYSICWFTVELLKSVGTAPIRDAGHPFLRRLTRPDRPQQRPSCMGTYLCIADALHHGSVPATYLFVGTTEIDTTDPRSGARLPASVDDRRERPP